MQRAKKVPHKEINNTEKKKVQRKFGDEIRK